jgi:hypothetical protein
MEDGVFRLDMLQNTFVHLPGVGIKTELALWESGIRSWSSFCDGNAGKPLPFARRRYEELRGRLDECRERLYARDPAYFAGSLGPHLWRLFAEFRDSAAYLDIETTGLGGPYDHITTATLYDGSEVFYYVYGDNLDLFARDLQKYRVLITYNGSCFDLPFIRHQFGIGVDHAHIDLRYLLSSLGYRGGLKGCEKSLGLDRAELAGVDGYFAVLLWREYCETGSIKALETLLAYNIADTVNLENLMVQSFNMKVEKTPFPDLTLPLPCPPAVPFKPDAALIDELRYRYFGIL